MTINHIKITGVAGIHELELNFNEGMNILCGPNGIGKTSVLESLAHLFVVSVFGSKVIKRNVTYDKASIVGKLKIDGKTVTQNLNFDTFLPNLDAKFEDRNLDIDSSYLISIKANRFFNYEELK